MMISIRASAPSDAHATDYDLRLLATYAALLDADRAGLAWEIAAARNLGLDPDAAGSRSCWASHLDRARWAVGDGLGAMIGAAHWRAIADPDGSI